MLTLEPPFYLIRGVPVFRDHADADQFYYLPPAPRLARSGDGPGFTLYKYRRDLTDNPELDPTRTRGAGLALFEVELPVERPTLLQAEVASRSGRPEALLSPVLFRSGEVRAIIAHTSGDRLIEDLVESRKAPPAYPHHASFAVALTAEGATLFEQAARGGQVPVGVVYDLRFLGLTPALHARVRMDYERIYDHFAASIGFTYYVSARLDLDLAWLIEHDWVKIEIIAFTDDPDRERQQALVMNLVKARIQNDFFRSGIPPKPEAGVGGPLAELLGGLLGEGEITSASALFVLKAKLEVVREQKEFELLYDGRTAVELTHVATGFLSTLVAGEADIRVFEIDTDDPFFSSLNVEVSSVIDFEDLADLREAAVHLAFGEHRAAFRFAPDAAPGPYRFQAPLTDPRADRYRWEAEYHFDPDLGSGPTQIQAGPFESDRRVLVIDPLAHFRYRRLRLLLGPVDPATVPRVRVRLRVPGAEGAEDVVRAEFVLDPEHSEQIWRLRLPIDSPAPRILARSDWEDARGEVHLGDEGEVTGESFVTLGPFRDRLALTVQPAVDWQRVTQLLVELRYEEGDYAVERRLVFDPDGKNAPQRWDILLRDPAHRRYRWRQVMFRMDGTVAETETRESDQSFLVVGREAPTTGEVRVVWVGTSGDALGLRVDFWVARPSGEEENVAIFLRAGEDQQVVTLPLDAEARLRYRYEVRRFTAAAEELLRSGEGQSNLLVVQATG